MWPIIQGGIINNEGKNYVNAGHLHELPSGPMNGEGSLLWGLRDASTDEFEPLFPEMADVLEITDGCAAQFQGQTNAGRVARAASGPSGVRRQSIISIAGHGKTNCDNQGATNAANVRKLSLSNQSPLFHGTRNVVLALSMFFPRPT